MNIKPFLKNILETSNSPSLVPPIFTINLTAKNMEKQKMPNKPAYLSLSNGIIHNISILTLSKRSSFQMQFQGLFFLQCLKICISSGSQNTKKLKIPHHIYFHFPLERCNSFWKILTLTKNNLFLKVTYAFCIFFLQCLKFYMCCFSLYCSPYLHKKITFLTSVHFPLKQSLFFFF